MRTRSKAVALSLSLAIAASGAGAASGASKQSPTAQDAAQATTRTASRDAPSSEAPTWPARQAQ
jgi:hypothetical protein